MSFQRSFDGLPEFAANPASMMASPAERRQTMATKRTFEQTSADFGQSVAATMLIDKPEAALPPMMRRALGSLAERTTAMDAGDSRVASRGDAPVYGAIMGKPPRTGWDASDDETVLIWCAARESEHSKLGYHAFASVPRLNYLAQQLSVLANAGSMLRQDRRRELERVARLDAPYMFATATEFARTWKFLGPISSLPEGYTGTGPINGGSRQRLVPYVVSGSARTRNIFSTSLREGDSIYVVVSERTSTSPDFVAPNGDIITPLSGTVGHPQLSVVGWSSADGSAYPLLSTRAGEPSDSDVDYTRRSVRIAQTFRTKEWDDATSTWYVRDVAAEEGAQEALAQAEGDSVFIDMHESGHVQPLGIVTDVPDVAVTQSAIEAGHRSGPAMAQLPVITYQSGLFA